MAAYTFDRLENGRVKMSIDGNYEYISGDASVNPEVGFIRINPKDRASFAIVLPADTVSVNGSSATGTTDEIAEQLATDIFFLAEAAGAPALAPDPNDTNNFLFELVKRGAENDTKKITFRIKVGDGSTQEETDGNGIELIVAGYGNEDTDETVGSTPFDIAGAVLLKILSTWGSLIHLKEGASLDIKMGNNLLMTLSSAGVTFHNGVKLYAGGNGNSVDFDGTAFLPLFGETGRAFMSIFTGGGFEYLRRGQVIPWCDTTERNALAANIGGAIPNGFMIYNTDTGRYEYWNTTVSRWKSLVVDGETPGMLAMQALGSAIKAQTLGTDGLINITTTTAMVDGQRLYNAIWLPRAETITGVKFYQGTQGNFTGDNFNGIGLFSYSEGVLTQVAVTANDANIWKGTSGTWQTVAFTTPVALQPGLYFVCYMYSNSAESTAPTIGVAQPVGASGVAVGDFTNSAKLNANQTSQTTMPSTVNMSSLNSFTTRYFTELY